MVEEGLPSDGSVELGSGFPLPQGKVCRSERHPPLDRRRFGRLLSGAVLGMSGLASLSAAAGPNIAPEIQAIKSRGKLLVSMTDFDSPPFYYNLATGDPSSGPRGWDVELARELAKALGVDCVITRDAGSFNAVVDRVASGAVDIGISKLSVTPKRAVNVMFSHPTIALRNALLANRLSLAKRVDDADIKSVLNRGFDGSIGVIANSSYADTARRVMSKASVKEYPDWDTVVSAVERGEVDLAYRDELEVKKLMRLRPDLHLSLRSVLVTDIHDLIAAALPSQSVQLQNIVNVIIDQRHMYDVNGLLDHYDEIFQSA